MPSDNRHLSNTFDCSEQVKMYGGIRHIYKKPYSLQRLLYVLIVLKIDKDRPRAHKTREEQYHDKVVISELKRVL